MIGTYKYLYCMMSAVESAPLALSNDILVFPFPLCECCPCSSIDLSICHPANEAKELWQNMSYNYLRGLTVSSLPHIAFLLLAWPRGGSNFGGFQTLHHKNRAPKMVSAAFVALSVIL